MDAVDATSGSSPAGDRAMLLRAVMLLPVAAVVVSSLILSLAERTQNSIPRSAPAGLRLILVTHPSCPECPRIAGALQGVRSAGVLDWSRPPDRAALKRVRIERERPASSVSLPLLVVYSQKTGAGSAYREWIGVASIAKALEAMGLKRDAPNATGHLLFAVAAAAAGVVASRWAFRVLGAAFLVGGFAAASKLGVQCAACHGPDLGFTIAVSGTGLLVTMAMAALWALSWRGATFRAIGAVLLAVTLATQLALIYADPVVCIPCLVFLGVMALASGAWAGTSTLPESAPSLLPGRAIAVGFGAAALSFGSLALAATIAPAESGGNRSFVAMRAEQLRIRRHIGAKAADLVTRGHASSEMRNAILVLGSHTCPGCESAYAYLAATFGAHVLFVQLSPNDGERTWLAPLAPDPKAPPTYTSTIVTGTIPVILVTDSAGTVMWEHRAWPADSEQAALLADSIRKALQKGRGTYENHEEQATGRPWTDGALPRG